MTNNIKLSARKTSFILAVSCILFSVIATYLYINHQIDLTRYTTPIILGTVVIIITCGGLQRVFYIFLTDECPQIFSDNQRNSIPDKVIPKPDMIIEECSEPTIEVSDIEMIEVSNATEVISMIELPEKTKNTDTTENKAVSSEIVTSITISEQHDDSKEIKVLEQQPTSEVKPEAFSYLQGFESRMEEIQKEELERKIMIINAIHEYTTYSTAKFLTKGGYSGFTNQDRYFSARLRVLKESKYIPAVVLGTSDPFTSSGHKFASAIGNGYFCRYYLAATKHFQLGRETLGVHLSYLYNRREDYPLNGVAGGITYNPSFAPHLNVIAEYDSKDFAMGATYLLFNHIHFQFELQRMKYFSGGLCYKIYLK